MVTDGSIEPPIPARDALLRVGSLSVLGVGLGALHLLTGLGIPCPFRAMTGWLCPLCGGTHMAEDLIRGDVAGAWAANPLVLGLVVLTGVRALGWIVEVARNPGAASHRWMPVAWRRHWLWTAVLVGVGYVLIRNLGLV